jgi:hypothetical protein
MKTFLARANSESSARETARGCFTTNLVIPGLGSLVGGRKIGYVQLVVCFSGLAISLIFGVRFILWSLAHWDEFHDPNADPIAALRDLWFQARWSLLGIVLFAIAWLWALLTSCLLLSEAKKKSAGN